MFLLLSIFQLLQVVQPLGWAGVDLEPLSNEGMHYISSFIRYKEDAISFSEDAQWPSACAGANNRVDSKLDEQGIRSYRFFVSTDCNTMIHQLQNKNAAKNIEMVPLQIFNSVGLRFDRGEIPNLALDSVSSSDGLQAEICASKERVLKNQIREAGRKIIEGESVIPLNSSDGKIYYVKISKSDDLRMNGNIRAQLAKVFGAKGGNSLGQFERSQMSGISSEVALNMSSDGRNLSSCNSDQLQGTVASQYCRAMVTNGVRVFLENKLGVTSSVAHAVGSSLYIPKEILNNKKPELGDIGIVNVNIFNQEGRQVDQKVLGTVFGDGSFYLVWQKDLK
jgi:hypothetical protein